MKKLLNGISVFFFLVTLLVLAGCPSPVKQEPVKPAIVTITYDNNGHGTLPEKKFVFLGLKLSENDLPELTETDWFFCGWEIDGRKAIVGEPVNKDITLKAIWKTDIPEFSITSGEIDYQTEVELSYFRQDAVIYYTINGSEPTEGSLIYREPIEITADTTIKALAIKDGKKSQIATAEYKLKLYTVTFETNGHGLAPGSMQKHKWEQINLPDVIPEVTLTFNHWTNGTDFYYAGELFTVTKDVTFTADWIGLNDVKTPKIRPEGEYVEYNDKVITITSETDGALIYYTTDETDPGTKSQKYTEPFAITKDTTIKALAIKDGMQNSGVSTKTYKIKKYTLKFDATGHGVPPDNITDKVKGEKITLPKPVEEEGWTFDRWNDGTTDYDAGAEFTVNENVTLKAKWTEWGKVASPSFSVSVGEVDKGTKVSIISRTEGASIYYTTDGSEPTTTSKKYESEIQITAGVTIKAIAVKSGMKNSEVASVAYIVDLTPPANVTNLTAKSTVSQTVKLTWTIPADTDFEKVVVTYGTDKKVEVLKTATLNNEVTVTGLTDETEYTFSVKAYDKAENASSGVDVKCKLGKTYTPVANSNGGLEGYSNQTQREIIKENWMAENGNLKVSGTEIAKTSEVVVIPAGTVATVTMPDDSSWSGYVENKADSKWKGVFLKGRKVKLDPFVMSRYQVTEQLWGQVMGEAATDSIEPKAGITWYEACAFCNELTKKTMTEADCVYYSDSGLTTPYTKGTYTPPYIAYNTETKKWTKKGYRLPTEAEWEFAARGGDPNAQEWKYAYAGVNSSGMVIDSTKANQMNYDRSGCFEKDENLSEYAVYMYSDGSQAVVGTKKENKLNLYDMSGNVWEWCYDRYNESATSDDSTYTTDGYVLNPCGSSGSYGVRRGGFYSGNAYDCSVSYRNRFQTLSGDNIGIRLVRSCSNQD